MGFRSPRFLGDPGSSTSSSSRQETLGLCELRCNPMYPSALRRGTASRRSLLICPLVHGKEVRHFVLQHCKRLLRCPQSELPVITTRPDAEGIDRLTNGRRRGSIQRTDYESRSMNCWITPLASSMSDVERENSELMSSVNPGRW